MNYYSYNIFLLRVNKQINKLNTIDYKLSCLFYKVDIIYSDII